MLRPGLQAPVLIIQKNSTVFYCRGLTYVVLIKLLYLVCILLYGHIGKPVPRIHPYLLADMEHAVCKTPGIGPCNIDVIAFRINGILLPFAA